MENVANYPSRNGSSSLDDIGLIFAEHPQASIYLEIQTQSEQVGNFGADESRKEMEGV